MSVLNPSIIPTKWHTNFKAGLMKPVDALLKKLGVEDKHHLKTGSTCIVFDDPKGQHVIKICTKGIVYFDTFKRQTVAQFQDYINTQFKLHFLPVSEILYDDANYFVYTQKKVKILDLPQMDKKIYARILDIFLQMVKLKVITPDLISSNLGFDSKGNMMMLDYHDLVPFAKYQTKDKWEKVIRCLMEFTSYLLHKEGFESHYKQSWSTWKGAAYMKSSGFGSVDKLFPSHFTQMFEAISGGNEKLIEQKIKECVKKLK